MDGRAERRLDAMRRVQAAALDLFEQRGYEQVTVEDIAAAAEVGPATVYRNFGGKERIVLWDEYDPMIFDAIAARLSEQPVLDAVQAVRTILSKREDNPLDSWVANDGRMVRLQIMVRDVGAQRTMDLIDELEVEMAGLFAPASGVGSSGGSAITSRSIASTRTTCRPTSTCRSSSTASSPPTRRGRSSAGAPRRRACSGMTRRRCSASR